MKKASKIKGQYKNAKTGKFVSHKIVKKQKGNAIYKLGKKK